MDLTNYERQIEVRWADVDQNRHVRHSAYYDYGSHVRIRFFADLGFSAKELEALRIGPILFKEQCAFIKEISPEETLIVNLLKGNVNADASRWILHHEILDSSRHKKAHITIEGAWIDLDKRTLTSPPKALAEATHRLAKGDYYTYQKTN